jgi:hypothetical protein
MKFRQGQGLRRNRGAARMRRLMKRFGVRVMRRATRRLRSELKQLERETHLAPF